MKQDLVSIILVHWNSHNFIDAFLDSLRLQTYQDTELIVFDNGSTDGSLKRIMSKCPVALILRNSENIGFAKAVNHALARSSGEYVFVTNPDIIIEPDFLSEMVNVLRFNQDCGSVAGKIYKLKDGLRTAEADCFSHFMWQDRRAMHLSQKNLDPSAQMYHETRLCFGAPACAAMYRRAMLEDIRIGQEVFDEDFFAYWEDVDVDWRALLRGWQSVYTPRAVGYHAREGSGLKKQRKVAAGFLANKFLLLIKNDSFRHVLKDAHIIIFSSLKEWLRYAMRDIMVVPLALGKIVTLTPRMLKKRFFIQKNRKVNQDVIDAWFENVNAMMPFRIIVWQQVLARLRQMKAAFSTSPLYREFGFWRTLCYLFLSLGLFFIVKVLVLLYLPTLRIFGLLERGTVAKHSSNGVARGALIMPVIPDISHHFVYREVEEILKKTTIDVIALVKGEDRYRCESLNALLRQVTFLHQVSDVRWFGLTSFLYYIIRSPASVVSLLDYYRNSAPTDTERNPFNLSLFWDPCNPLRGFSLARYLDKLKISYCHCFGSTIPATQMLLAHRLLGIPFSVTAFVDFDFSYPFKMLVEKLFIAKFFVVTTEFCKKRLLEYGSATYAEKIFIIPCAIPISQYRRHYAIKDNMLVKLLGVGRLVEKKGFKYLIEAVKILNEHHAGKFVCTIVGDGPLREQLQKDIKAGGLSSVFSLAGGVTVDSVRDFYSRSDILVHPGIEANDGERDGIPNVITEAMAMEVPVIATAVSGIPELIRDGNDGVLVPQKDPVALANAIRNLAGNASLQRTMVKNAKQRVKECADVTQTAEMLFTLLKKYYP
ncbi:MAG: glycosyltransferase [Candidatus Omnitrophica bacterium]|nr:glycosyltransferase [Candidatus Omnitrophota bacterium]